MHDLENKTGRQSLRRSATGIQWPGRNIFLLVAFWCIQLRGATNDFETPPPKPGSVKWENLQRVNKERQERYRKNVPVPGAMDKDVPRAGGGNFATPLKTISAPASSSVAWKKFFKYLFFVAFFVFVGLMLVRKLAPRLWADLKQRFTPRLPVLVAGERFPEKVRAEEEAFTEFLAAFRVGPVASTPVRTFETHDPVKEFYASATKRLAAQQKLLQSIGRETDSADRQKLLASLHSEMKSLKGESGFPEALPVWQMASALEGLLKQLTDKVGNVTSSTLRAVTGGVDLLDKLCAPGLEMNLLTDHPFKFLIVDDDLISSQAISIALKKAFSQPDLAVDGETALTRCDEQIYDVIFLDVQLPGMNGFELCEKIRNLGPNHFTPVVFVTGQNDFDARAKSALSGGSDLMGKPFLTFEITVKALTLALQKRLQEQLLKPIPQPGQGEDILEASAVIPDRPFPATNIITAPAPVLAPASADEFINAFLSRASTQFGPLREICQALLQASDIEKRQSMLADGFLRINSLVSRNDPGAMHPACQICLILEGLFKKMLEDPKHSTPSMLATTSAAVELLNELCAPGIKMDIATNPPFQMLVVDDDLVARRVIVGALQTVFPRPESVEDGDAAIAVADKKTFDVIFLDVQMPRMDGFNVCAKIRGTVFNRATPVIFVTGNYDVETRARVNRSGGNDLIEKPFLTAEITAKAFTFALRGRLGRHELVQN